MPELLCYVGGGITLCYETFGDPSDPAALLIMGLGAQMVAWQDDFCLELAARGLYVVRFDNRDIGRSTHLQGPPPSLGQLLRYSVPPTNYTLADMAQDAVGLMDELGISSAHVIGASMGGMIAQTLAARHPTRVRSLVSMLSSTGGRWVGRPALSSYAIFLRKAPREREAFIEHANRLFAKVGSRGIPQDNEGVRRIAALSFDRETRSHRNRAPARRDHRLRRPHRGARADHCADARNSRQYRSAGLALGRSGDGPRNSGSKADDDRGHGPRPAARALAAPDRRLRLTRRRG